METFLQDLRFALRNLRHSKGVTAIALITLALGIGANTAIFSVINAVLLQPLPFKQPGELVRLYETEAAPGNYPLSPPDYLDWKAQNHTFQDMTLFGYSRAMNLSDSSAAASVHVVPTEANFFDVLGVRTLYGRTWVRGEDQPGSPKGVVLGYGLWKRLYNGDPNVVGKNIELDNTPYAIVGVMPRGFTFPFSAQLWTAQEMDSKSLGKRGTHWAGGVGRLKPGSSVQGAQGDLAAISRRLEEQFPDSNRQIGAVVLPLQEDMVGRWRDSLIIMFVAVGLVLLIACANVANLLLSRGVVRQREMAIRSALGAARARLVRQLLTESVVLAVAGGLLGILLALGGVSLLTSLKSFPVPSANLIRVNGLVLVFALAAAVATGLLFGLFPAMQISRPEVYEDLKGARSSTGSRQKRHTSNGLVIAEVALSLLLLISAGLFLKDFAAMRNTDIGVRTTNVWTGAVQLPAAHYKEQQSQFLLAQQLLEKAKHIPGVETASISDRLPLEGGSNSYVKIRGSVASRNSGPLVEYHNVTADYFTTMGIPVLQGRNFNDADVQLEIAIDEQLRQLAKGSTPTKPEQFNQFVYRSVINKTMAERFWPGQNPIGKMYSPGSDTGPWHEVVGVVADVKQWGIAQPAQPEGYDVFDGSPGWYLVLHTAVPPAVITNEVRKAVVSLDRTLPVFAVRTMPEVIADNSAGPEFMSLLLGLFAGIALLLAAVGIYGVLSYAVTQRTREIGIRVSLGAAASDVLRLVLSQGLRLAMIGFVIGIAGAFASRRLLASSLHMIKPADPAIFVATPLLLSLVAILACVIPARRAARIDPIVALREE